jgi:predicted Zn finger-like uncharacterized protein
MPINDKLIRRLSTMIITCQQCHTNYNVDANKIGVGKTVRCQNCSNSWHQKQVQAPTPLQPRPSDALESPSMAQTTPTAAIEDSRKIFSDEVPEDNKNLELDTEPSSESDALSSELLDDMFGEDMDSDSFFSDDNPMDENKSDLDEPEDFEDPEPIPGVFMNQDNEKDEDEGETDGKRKKLVIAGIALILVLCGAIFFSRSYIMDMFGGSQIGEGLDIQNVKSVRKDVSGVDILMVNGVVANTSNEERQVPMIKVVLYDSSEKEVEKTIVAPLKNILKAGAKIRFSAKLSKPSSLARRMEVTFTETKKP